MRRGGQPFGARRLGVQFGQRLGQREGAFARRVDQPALRPRRRRTRSRGVDLEQVARRERASARASPLRRGVVARALRPASRCPRCPAPRAARVASGSVKLPRPQNQSITRSCGCGVEQAQRARHQHAVDVRVDLREVGRLERHRDAELGQRVGQLRRRLRRAAAPSPGPLGCSHHCTPCAAPKSRSRCQVGGAQRLQVAQHQRRHARRRTASSICGRRSRCVHRADQRAQRQQQRAHVRRQHRAAPHVGHVARLALVEADQHRALLAPRGAPTGARGSGSPRPGLRSAAARARAAPCPGATGCLRARAA